MLILQNIISNFVIANVPEDMPIAVFMDQLFPSYEDEQPLDLTVKKTVAEEDFANMFDEPESDVQNVDQDIVDGATVYSKLLEYVRQPQAAPTPGMSREIYCSKKIILSKI